MLINGKELNAVEIPIEKSPYTKELTALFQQFTAQHTGTAFMLVGVNECGLPKDIDGPGLNLNISDLIAEFETMVRSIMGEVDWDNCPNVALFGNDAQGWFIPGWTPYVIFHAGKLYQEVGVWE